MQFDVFANQHLGPLVQCNHHCGTQQWEPGSVEVAANHGRRSVNGNNMGTTR